MQNAGQQYCQGGATSHQNQAASFSHAETSNTNNGGSTTSSLRQFRRKIEDKHSHTQDTNQRQIPESHVARVAPQNHFPPRTSECYRFPNQYQEYNYSVPSQVKYSEISEPPQSVHQGTVSPASVIQKAKGSKDYMEICNPPHVVKPSYNDLHMNNQQQNYNDGSVLPQAQYIPKDTQSHPLYKPESQYFPKEPQYPAQLQNQMQKYNMPPATHMRKFPPSENEFLSKLQQINPTVARSIMSDHHLQEPQKTYQNLDQNRLYPLHSNQRYMGHSTAMHYPHPGYMPPQPYPNYASSCNYARSPQISQTRFPTMGPHESSISPRRNYTEGMSMSMNYPGMPPKMSPNYPQYNTPDFAQHYQQRRPSMVQDCYQQHYRPAQYLPHQMQAQEIPENRVTVSDSIKQYIENWADEETASEMNQLEANRFNKDNLRVREDPLSETVYTINANEIQYLEPLVESENAIPLVSIDNSSGMFRIVDKNCQVDFTEHSGDRIVNVHIMEPPAKSDCMLASNKPNELNQRLNEGTSYSVSDKSKVVIHQNTVIQSSSTQIQNLTKDADQTPQTKVGSSLPMITDEQDPIEELKRSIIQECRKEIVQTVDKNCSPINMEEIEAMKEDRDYPPDMEPMNLEISKSIENNVNKKTEIEVVTERSFDEKIEDNAKILENKDGDELFKPSETNDEIRGEKEKLETNESTGEELKESEEADEKIGEAVEIENDKSEDTKEPNEEISNSKCDGIDKTAEMKDDAETEEKNSKRSKRIFSVDDIINNIGQNAKISKRDKERRHSLHCVMEFLDKEINNTFVFDIKEKMEQTKEIEAASESKTEEQHVITEVPQKSNEAANNIDEKTNDSTKASLPQAFEKILTKNICTEDNSESSQDLLFRNIIKVEESNVLLHIAGELVEINVASVNGKKVITVTPLSSSAMVDFNDNYETLDSNEIPEVLKFEDPEIENEETQVLEIETVVPEPDCVEPSSEVIIGMDLSLEEEIKLDVEQPQILCTKAAKKAYDNDLQIPSITTSEDVNNKPDIYNTNDKVSSTKEKLRKDSSAEVTKSPKSEREKLREFRKVKKPSKVDNNVEDDDEEFVPFKELIEARRIKKLKMLKKKNEEIVKADSTNKDDEIVKEVVIEKNSNEKVKESKASVGEIKKHRNDSKRSTGRNSCDTNRNKGRSRDKRKSLEKSSREKVKKEKKTDEVKTSAEQDHHSVIKEVATKNPDPIDPPKEADKQTVEVSDSKIENVTESENQVTIQEDRIPDSKVENVTSIVPDTANPVTMIQTNRIPEVTAEQKEKEVPCAQISPEQSKSSQEFSALETPSSDQSETSKTNIPLLCSSKLSKETENSEGKKKLSLQEYNNRKRKLLDKTESPSKKFLITDSLRTFSAIRSQRPKSLDDLDSLRELQPPISVPKRKLSLGSISIPNGFDWDETQSPKSNLDVQEKRFSEFRGLINNKSTPKTVIDQSEDKTLQNYKKKVESKLSSLNIQIPNKFSKVVGTEDGGSKSETSSLMDRFLKNDKLTPAEMEKIRKIISYKRLIQQMNKVKPRNPNTNNDSKHESTGVESDTKMNLKNHSVPIKKKKKRFRNLYGTSSSDSEDETVETKNVVASGDYSVVQSNCLAGVVPKLIIKRKPEMPLPYVKLERLDMKLLVAEKRVCIE